MTKEEKLFAAIKVANVFLAGGGVGLVLLWFYVFYHYGWPGETRLVGPRSIVAYYVIPPFLAALLFASRRLKPAYKISLAALCILMAASLYAIELLISVPARTAWVTAPREERNQFVRLAKQYGVVFDIRDSAEVTADLRKQGVEAVSLIFPRAVLKRQHDGRMKSVIYVQGGEVVPLGAIPNKLTVLCNQSGDYVFYTSDEHGFHNSTGVWQSNHVDIAALGKSYTQGYCVPSDKNFVALIRNHHPATLNLGMATHGPLFMLATIKEYLRLVSPRIVLWFYAEGHLSYLEDEKRSPLLTRYLKDDFIQDLLARRRDIDRALMDYVGKEPVREMVAAPQRPDESGKRVKALRDAIKLPTLRQNLGLVDGDRAQEPEDSKDIEANMNLFREILSQAKTHVGSWGGKLTFVYLPSWRRYASHNHEIFEDERTGVLTVASSLGIPVVDVQLAFAAQSDPLSLFPFRRFYHYTEQGHRIVAEEVLKAIPPRKPDHFAPQ
jgi:hypothetical protein